MTEKKLPKVVDVTPDDDAEIRNAIANDPDTWEARPGTTPRRRGRPIAAQVMRWMLSGFRPPEWPKD